MSRPTAKVDAVYEFLLAHFRYVYYREQSKKFIRTQDVQLTSKNAIVKFIHKAKHFIDSGSYKQDELKPDLISVSANTIRKAVEKLEFDAKIEIRDGRYQYIPQLEDKLANHPILNTAADIPITIGVPESLMILTVGNGAAVSVANYLSAVFHKNDIVFIPLGDQILCISTLPKSVLDLGKVPNRNNSIPPSVLLRERIKAALYQFDLRYPHFDYHNLYEIDYLAKYHPAVKSELLDAAGEMAENTYRTYSFLQYAISRYAEDHYDSPEAMLTRSMIEDNLSDFLPNHPNSTIDDFFDALLDWDDGLSD